MFLWTINCDFYIVSVGEWAKFIAKSDNISINDSTGYQSFMYCFKWIASLFFAPHFAFVLRVQFSWLFLLRRFFVWLVFTILIRLYLFSLILLYLLELTQANVLNRRWELTCIESTCSLTFGRVIIPRWIRVKQIRGTLTHWNRHHFRIPKFKFWRNAFLATWIDWIYLITRWSFIVGMNLWFEIQMFSFCIFKRTVAHVIESGLSKTRIRLSIHLENP